MRKVDVAIVGGGVIGWSVAYHLSKLAPSLSVVVFDKKPSFAMGSTGKAAGGVRAQFGTPVNVDLSLHSIRFFEEHADEVGFRQYGYLFVTAQKGGAEYLERIARMQHERGVPVEKLSKDDIARRADYIVTDDLLLGSLSPTDGYLDPHVVCDLFQKTARASGVEAIYSCEPSDVPDAETTVLATGHWSNQVGKHFGIDLPITPEKHQLAMTDAVPELPEKLPMVVDLDTSFHFRREGKGLLVGYNYSKTEVAEDPDREPAFDYGFLEELAPIALKRLPVLENQGFDTKSSWAGYYAETPDHHAIIGRVGNVVVCTGFGGHGVMHSPAAGFAAGEIIVRGESRALDINALRPSRFAEGDLVSEEMVI